MKVDAVIAARHDKSLPCVIALEAVIAEVATAITHARRLFGSVHHRQPDGLPHWTRRLTCSPRKRTAHRRDGRAVGRSCLRGGARGVDTAEHKGKNNQDGHRHASTSVVRGVSMRST